MTNQKINEDIVQRAKELRKHGYSYRQIARLLSVSKSWLCDKIGKESSGHRPAYIVQDSNTMSLIFQEFGRGKSCLEIVEQYGLEPKLVEQMYNDYQRLKQKEPKPKYHGTKLQQILENFNDSHEDFYKFMRGVREELQRINLKIAWIMSIVQYDGQTLQQLFDEMLNEVKNKKDLEE